MSRSLTLFPSQLRPGDELDIHVAREIAVPGQPRTLTLRVTGAAVDERIGPFTGHRQLVVPVEAIAGPPQWAERYMAAGLRLYARDRIRVRRP